MCTWNKAHQYLERMSFLRELRLCWHPEMEDRFLCCYFFLFFFFYIIMSCKYYFITKAIEVNVYPLFCTPEINIIWNATVIGKKN